MKPPLAEYCLPDIVFTKRQVYATESQIPRSGPQSPGLCLRFSLSYGCFHGSLYLSDTVPLLGLQTLDKVLPLHYTLLTPSPWNTFSSWLHGLLCPLLQVIVICSLKSTSSILPKTAISSTPTLFCYDLPPGTESFYHTMLLNYSWRICL